jgi:hypothetical protein
VSYVDLFSPIRRWQQRIPLVYQAEDGEHELQLTVLERANLASEGTLIGIDAFQISSGERRYALHGVAVLLAVTMLVAGGLTFREWKALRRMKP